MKVKEVMNSAIAVDHDITIKAAAKIMSEKNIGSLVVLKDDNIIGIVTEHDILSNIESLDKKIFSVMVRKVVTINENEELDDAAIILFKNKIKKLPVVNKKGNLVGIITSTDLIAHSEDLNEDFLF